MRKTSAQKESAFWQRDFAREKNIIGVNDEFLEKLNMICYFDPYCLFYKDCDT